MRQEMWERMGVDVAAMVKYQLNELAELKAFQTLLFSKVVPNCKRLGLLDTASEYEDLDAVAADRS